MGFKVYLRKEKGKKENFAKKIPVKLLGFYCLKCCPRKASPLV